ncbi:ABC transporter permease [Occultella glacieicola]|uniref:ABC transporter permease n=1 Tax=Occultella glacieicola TaxID=2518684 RepID=A0ABY2EA72_9MICO|nr:ABC transporter permease [Occultella glacieicola]TDE98845.1 ABC transporter permease [Occultella glacieicola]
MTDTTTSLPPARRLPAAAWGQMFLAESRMIVRDTSGLLIPIGLPLLLMVMNGIGDGGDVVLPGGATVMNAILMPLTITMVVTLVGVVNMPSFLASYRKYGILKRLAVTPARPAMILVAQMLVSLVQVLLGVALMMGVAAAFFGVTQPQSLGWALLAGGLLLAAMYGVGILIAALAPTTNAALAIGLGAFFVMLALGGGFGQVSALPDVLQAIGAALPFGAGNAALSAAWVGAVPEARHLLALGAWAVVTGGLAAKFFRWT